MTVKQVSKQVSRKVSRATPQYAAHSLLAYPHSLLAYHSSPRWLPTSWRAMSHTAATGPTVSHPRRPASSTLTATSTHGTASPS
eukprot:scaffold29534_cov36-Phaeocystis_antarctica.AAC.1